MGGASGPATTRRTGRRSQRASTATSVRRRADTASGYGPLPPSPASRAFTIAAERVGDLQLGEDVRDVVAHRLEADEQFVRDRGVALAGGDQLEQGFYKVMTASYRTLLAGLAEAGYPSLVGADWNSPLDHARESWSPVPTLNGIGFATNWQSSRPCDGTSKHGGNIDGWAYMPAAHQLVDHGCLEYGLSDHRPVWITVRPVIAEE